MAVVVVVVFLVVVIRLRFLLEVRLVGDAEEGGAAVVVLG